MELFSLEFLAALAAIVVIDIVLAGDNAVVIALAARDLPAELRRRAVLWGTAGAIAARTVMTFFAVWLLKFPGLRFAGGAALVWIAFRLLSPAEDKEGHGPESGPDFLSAIRTIVIADTIMGVDNVLAVAGAARGSFLLVVLGLLISIPIVVWGSQLILRWIDRFPALVYIGAGVLAFTAAQMMLDEPVVREWLSGRTWIRVVACALVTVGVLAAGYATNGRLRST